MKNILFLYTQIADYFLNCVSTILQITSNCNVIFVASNIDPNAPYKIDNLDFNVIINQDNDIKKLLGIYAQLKPDIIYIAGWTDKNYLRIGKQAKQENKIVILGMDNPWRGDIRQYIGRLYFSLFFKKNFSHIWIPGLPQYEFARRMGFSQDKILLNLYSANTNLFLKANTNFKSPIKTLLYVGRLIEKKGIIDLCEVFTKIKIQTNSSWRLLLVGNGELKGHINSNYSAITCVDFVQPEILVEIASSAQAFILPSHYEPWGVVIHEFAAAGLPIIASNEVGATFAFVKNNYNGFIFKSKNKIDLEKCLLHLMRLDSDDLELMGSRSRSLAKQINPEIWAHTLMNVLT